MDSINDIRCMHPLVKLKRNVEYTILVVASSPPNKVVQCPGAFTGSIDCVWEIKLLNTRKGIRPTSRKAANSM